jgi:hypothetical protein
MRKIVARVVLGISGISLKSTWEVARSARLGPCPLFFGVFEFMLSFRIFRKFPESCLSIGHVSGKMRRFPEIFPNFPKISGKSGWHAEFFRKVSEKRKMVTIKESSL